MYMTEMLVLEHSRQQLRQATGSRQAAQLRQLRRLRKLRQRAQLRLARVTLRADEARSGLLAG